MAKTVILSLTRKQSQVRLDVVQYTTAPDIVFVIEDYTPTGRADFYIEKPSGEEIYNHCTIDGNKVIFTPTTQCFAEVGEQKAQLQLLDGDKMAVSFPIQLVVAENIIDSSAAESQSEFTELQDAISTIGQYDQRIQDVQDAMDALETELTDDMAALQTNITRELDEAITGVAAQITNINNELNSVNTEIDTLGDAVQSLADNGFIPRRQLTINDDLNDITTPGIYYYGTGDVPANCYFENAGIVEVIYANAPTPRIIQRVTRYGTAGQSAFRVKDYNGWRDWVAYATSADTAALGTRITTAQNRADAAYGRAGDAISYTENLAGQVQDLDRRNVKVANCDSGEVLQTSTAVVGVRAVSGSRNFVLLATRNRVYLYNQTEGATEYDLSLDKYGIRGDADSITFNNGIFAGHVTNSSKAIDFFVPTPKSCKGKRAILIGATTVAARYGGYVNGKTDLSGDFILPASCNTSELGIFVRLEATDNQTWKRADNSTNMTNNTPVTVTGTLTFSIYD